MPVKNDVVEIIGIPGSGKTHLSISLEGLYSRYLTLRTFNSSRMDNKQLIRLASAFANNKFSPLLLNLMPRRLIVSYINLYLTKMMLDKRYLKDKPWAEFGRYMERSLFESGLYFPEKIDTFNKYLCLSYRGHELSDSVVLEDGGFLFRFSYFLDHDNNPYDPGSVKYLKFVPLMPNKVIWLRLSPELALERIGTRSDSIVPFFLRDTKNNSQKIHRLQNLDQAFKQLISDCPEHVKVLQIDASGPFDYDMIIRFILGQEL